MKTIKPLLIVALVMLLGACGQRQVSDNQFAYNHMPFKNLNWSVLGFGAYTITIDKCFVPSEPKQVEGTRTIYKYHDPVYEHLEIIFTVDEGNEYILPTQDILYHQKGRLNTMVYASYNPIRYNGVSVLKFRDVGGRKLYVEFKTGRHGGIYVPADANHLIAKFDTYINMKSEGHIVLDMPPCPFEIFEHTK